MLIDLLTYLPDEILVKTDRASMRYALELRSPILDARVMEYAFRIPMKWKQGQGTNKFILRDIAYDFVPKEMLDRPKQGFGVPIRKWLLGILYPQLEHFANKNLLDRQQIFRHEVVWTLIEGLKRHDIYRYSSLVWAFFCFQLWYDRWIDTL